MKSNATNIPKKKEAMKFTIDVFSILNPTFIFKLSCINILRINPKALPNKKFIIEAISKFTLSSSLL